MKLISKINIRTEDVPEDEVIFDFIISTSDFDKHHSRMSESTLRNYANDAENGVPFMIEHSKELSRQLGLTSQGRYVEGQTEASVRILRDTEDTPTELKVNEYIRRIERGFYNSVSVGFHDAEQICDMCGKGIWDTDRIDPCEHVPGQVYDGERCTYTVDDARLREVSLVSNPSNENAKIIERSLTDEIRAVKKTPELNQAELELKKYRESLISDAIKAGVRAIDDFNVDVWQERLKNQDTDFIKDMKKAWDTIGDQRWRGGRKTGDIDNTESDKINLPNFLFS